MKILVIGGGGREHAIAWKLRHPGGSETTAQSNPENGDAADAARKVQVWCAPGNGGIAEDADCIELNLGDVKAAADLAARLGADLTICGPELPLVNGLADEFAARGLKALGPGRAGTQLEGSKVFAKEFMQRHGIPTAALYGIYESPVDAHTALAGMETVDWPLVIKADGLCAGKGVLVAKSPGDAAAFVTRVMESGEFGEAGRRVIFEEGLSGEELSYIVLTDGKDFLRMAPARDHKRAYERDEGPNTGGMGAYSADELLPGDLEREIIATIVRPTMAGLAKEGIEYRGFLYFGLMLARNGPRVLEYNCRLGDPETEAILLRADFDLGEVCAATAEGELARIARSAKWFSGASACVVIASEGYPGRPMTGRPIRGLPARGTACGENGALVFHAGTRGEGDAYYTSGGRVLVVSARGNDLGAALRTVYDAISHIHIEGAFYRGDIGVKRSVA